MSEIIPFPEMPGWKLLVEGDTGVRVYVRANAEPIISVVSANLCSMLGPEGHELLTQYGAKVVTDEPDYSFWLGRDG